MSTTPLLMLMTRSMMGMMELMTTLTSLSLHHSLIWRILTRVTDTSMTGDLETTGHQPKFLLLILEFINLCCLVAVKPIYGLFYGRSYLLPVSLQKFILQARFLHGCFDVETV